MEINYIVMFHDETDARDYFVWEYQKEGQYVQEYGGIEKVHGTSKDGTQYIQDTNKFNQLATIDALEGILENATDKTTFYLRTKGIDGKFKPGSKAVSRAEFVDAVRAIPRSDH